MTAAEQNALRLMREALEDWDGSFNSLTHFIPVLPMIPACLLLDARRNSQAALAAAEQVWPQGDSA